MELLTAPFTNLHDHFESMSDLAKRPDPLSSRILIAVRTKPRHLGEDPVLHAKLSVFTEESIHFLNGLSFSQCIDLADCVVGVNIPTTANFEVLDQGVPLIFFQTADSVTLHPDLPSRVTATVRSPEAIWPAIESVLFDPTHRRRLLEIQQRFLRNDRKPKNLGGTSIKDVVLRLTTGFRFPFLSRRKPPLSACASTADPETCSNFDLEHAIFNPDSRRAPCTSSGSGRRSG